MTRMLDDRTPISPFLAAKLHVPALPRAVVLRPRLLDRLEQGLKNNHCLTLISAPAGYGKTTLIAEWLAELSMDTSGPLVAWISADPGDSDPSLFFAYLLLALERTGQAYEWVTHTLLQQPSQVAEQVLAEGLLQDLAAVVATENRPLVLVLDDMHRISSPAIYAVLQQVIERLPPGCHAVMLTREDPPLSLARLRIHQRVTELRARDLRFTSSEAERFLNQIMALDLPAEAVEALALRTEGWIAGLQLAALSLENEGDRSAFIGSFAGDDRQVVDYLLEEVLMRQPPDLRRFLLYSSILERMSGPLCDALLAEDGAAPDDSLLAALEMRSSQAVLEELERRNLFLVSLDNRRTWYRYHHLFGELLYTNLQLTCDEATIRGLHLRAATWHGDHGFPTAAVSHALKADDHELAARLVEGALARPATWSSGNIGLLHDWWRALPANVLHSRPLLSLRISRALYLSGRLDEAERLLDTTAQALQDSRVLPGDADSLQAQITIYRAAILAMRGEVERALDAVSGALPRLGEDDRLPRARAYDTLGLAHELRGHVDEAIWAYLEASVLAEEAGVLYLAVNARCEAARVQILQGQLRQALATCESAIALGETHDPAMAPLGLAWSVMGDIRREQNDLESAARCLERGIELSRKGGITDDLRYEYLYLAQLQQCQGETEEALHSLQEADLLLHIYGVARLTELVAAQRTRVWLSQEQVELAERWADAYVHQAPTEYVREYEELTLARVLLVQGELDAAADRLHTALAAAEAGGRMGVVLECLVLLARAAAGRAADERSGWLTRALTLAEPEGYARVFLDEGLPMAELLASVPAKSPGARYARRLGALFGEQSAPHPQPLDDQALPHPPGGALIEPLTDREQEVLVLLSQRLTNAEIAQRLVISLPTVKSHTAHIYAKLDVGDRRAAVERAQALGLLPQ